MEERREITSLEQLRCLTNSLRNRIILLFSGDEALSVQQMAQRLGMPHGKVYYHVRQLILHGFLEETSQSTINGIVERFYLPTARSFVTSAELSGNPALRDSLAKAGDELLDRMVGQIRECMKTLGGCGFTAKEIYMTEEERRHFSQEVDRLLDPYIKARPGAERTKYWSVICNERGSDSVE